MIKKIFRKLGWYIRQFFGGIVWYTKDFFSYKKLLRGSGIALPLFLFPKIFDKDPASHTFDKHYVYMDRWAFGKLLAAKPQNHADVGSSIRFLSMVELVLEKPTFFRQLEIQ